MSKHTFTSTSEKRSGDAVAYTTQPMATPHGWQGDKPARRQAPATRPAPTVGTHDQERIADIMQGVRESHDHRAKTAAIMVGAYVGVRALQHWSARKRQQRGR